MERCGICNKEFFNRAGLASHQQHCPSKIEKKRRLLVDGGMICEFGCGRLARFVLKMGRACCGKSHNSCPEMKRKNGEFKKNKLPPWKDGKHPRGMLGKDSWNKGKTLIELIGEIRAKEIGNRISKSLIGNPNLGSGKTEDIERERREKIRRKINDRYASGWIPKAGRCKKVYYTSLVCGAVVLDGSWEFEFAKFLDSSGELWNRNKRRFLYFFDGRWRHYTPDFYIGSLDVFIEVKGYKTDKDVAKWSQFPKELRLIPVGKSAIFRIKEGTYTIDEIREACDNWQSASLLNS